MRQKMIDSFVFANSGIGRKVEKIKTRINIVR